MGHLVRKLLASTNEQFKGTKAMTRGRGGNRLYCLREVQPENFSDRNPDLRSYIQLIESALFDSPGVIDSKEAFGKRILRA